LRQRGSITLLIILSVLATAGFGWYFIAELGWKVGIGVTLAAVGLVIYTAYEQRFFDKYLGKRKFKAFDRDR
jgi:hypothetical protein